MALCLAWAGGAVAYVPFLTILLPVRIASFTQDAQVEWLAYMTFFGALSASISAEKFSGDCIYRRCVPTKRLSDRITTPMK